MTVNEISRRLFGAFTLAAGTTMASPKAVAQSDVQGSFRPMKMRSIIVNELTVTDPHEHRDIDLEGVPATKLLDAAFGPAWRDAEEVVATCQDGFHPSIPVKTFLEHGGPGHATFEGR